jgi:hypothetical protein
MIVKKDRFLENFEPVSGMRLKCVYVSGYPKEGFTLGKIYITGTEVGDLFIFSDREVRHYVSWSRFVLVENVEEEDLW